MSNTPQVRFRKLDPEQNMKRYYCITLTKTLFDEWCIVRTWGRLGRGGQTRQLTLDCEREARTVFDRLVMKRQARNYNISDGADVVSASVVA
jgi:predicted DNA-binding WGR domain protein